MTEAFLIILIKAIVIIFAVITTFAYLMLLERKLNHQFGISTVKPSR